MLPPIATIDEYRALRRDLDTQRDALTIVAERHGLPVTQLEPFTGGTHIVWRAGASVIKVFAPLWPEDAGVEMALLRRVTGTDLCVPQLEHEGELRGESAMWPYVVMSHVRGEAIGTVWPRASQSERLSLAHQMGEIAAGLAALPTAGLEHLRVTQDELLAERLPQVRADQRTRGGDDTLDAAVAAFVSDLPAMLPAEPVLLHADLTDDHFLVDDGRIVGLIDFADAFVGPWTYELAAPSCFMARGNEACERAMLAGRGVTPSTELLSSIRAWCVLHRYAHVHRMMRASDSATFAAWHRAFYAWSP